MILEVCEQLFSCVSLLYISSYYNIYIVEVWERVDESSRKGSYGVNLPDTHFVRSTDSPHNYSWCFNGAATAFNTGGCLQYRLEL